MAKMIPPYISEEVKSSGEKQIFEQFKNDPDTKDWIVLHSLTLSRHTKRLYGEIDFLVMAPGQGVFCLEIKSGEVRRQDGIWKFTNRFGETTSKSRGPFEQAQDGMFSLKESVKRKFGDNSRLNRILFGFGVMFPHISFTVNGLEYENWQVYDRESRRLPVSIFIKQLAFHSKKKVENCTWFNEKDCLPSREDIEVLTNFLRGDFERLITPTQRINDVEEQLNQYTEEQFHCLNQLEDNPRCLFLGAGGTGKTMLAIESVRRSLFETNRVLFVCYNVFLAEWLKQQFPADKYGDQICVGTFHGIMSKIAACKDTWKPQGDISEGLQEKNDYFKYELPLNALEEIDKGKVKTFDKLIIDEGQDLIRDEYLDVLNAMLRGGLSGGKWEIYGDFEKQAIYSGLSSSEMMDIIQKRANFVKFRLTVNCRNTQPIGEEVALMTGYEKPLFLPNKIEGIPVDYFFWESEIDQIKKLESLLITFRNQRLPTSNITLLSPYKWENSVVSKVDKGYFKIGEFVGRFDLQNTENQILFSTIQSFKGLENSYIILLDINRLMDDEFKSLLYVGMSRAKIGLSIMVSTRAKCEFNEIIKRGVK